MTLRTKDFAFEVKSISEDGSFSGYGSVFGVVDSYGEIVAAGAFLDSLASHKTKGTMPALLWQHRSSEPLGVFTSMTEDSIGLKVEGQIALKTQRGAEAYELLKMKAISGLSIGFIPRDEIRDKATGITTLKKVDLWETSLVTFPANDAARVQGVKSIEQLESIRSAEKYLRDLGLSNREALALISRVKSLSQSDSDEDGVKLLHDALMRRTNPVKSK
jgi:HK97 family phage prohead protease